MMRIETSTARGMVRFGLWLSSASGAAPSQPVRAKIANTTPRNRPCGFPPSEPRGHPGSDDTAAEIGQPPRPTHGRHEPLDQADAIK